MVIAKVLSLFLLLFVSCTCLAQQKSQEECGSKSPPYVLKYPDSLVYLEPAAFPRGEEALMAWLMDSLETFDTLKYYKLSHRDKIYVKIYIDENGKLEKSEFHLNNVKNCPVCDSMVLVLLKRMPCWQPAVGVYAGGTQRKEKYARYLPFWFKSYRRVRH